MVRSELLKDRMKELNLKQDYVADKMKMAQSTLNLKINNARAFTIEEMFKLGNVLKLEDDQLREYFFATRLAKRKNSWERKR